MARGVVALVFVGALAMTQAFVPAMPARSSRQSVVMKAENENSLLKHIKAGISAATLLALPLAANAVIDYEGVGYLGGGDKVDLNNANVRAYVKYPGMYPTVAGKIVSHGPYKSVADVYSIPGLTEAEKSVLKKYEGKFLTLDPAPEYVIDRINNGLYR